MRRRSFLLVGVIALLVAVASVASGCGGEEKEVQVVQTVVVEKQVQVPGETKIVEKEVQVPVVQTVIVAGETKIVEKEVPVVQTVVVAGETKIVEKEVPVVQTVVVEQPVDRTVVVYKDPRAGGTLRVPGDTVVTLDPHSVANPGNAGFMDATFEMVFGRRHDISAGPMLADRWELSPDGLTWKITLRDGVTYHNGDTLTALDARMSIQRSLVKKALMNRLDEEFIDSWTETDDLTFELKLNKPASFLLDAFAETWRFVTPKSIWERDVTTNPSNDVIGTGPYKLDRWVPGDRVIATRYDDYKPTDAPSSFQVGKKVALMDRIEWIVVGDESAMVAALQTGQLDLINTVSPQFRGQLEKDKSVDVVRLGFPVVRLAVWLNHSRPPFDDQRVRKALQMAYTMENVLLAANGPSENWRLCASYWTCGSAWESDVGSEAYNVKDVEGARQIIEDLGLTGTEVTIIVNEENTVISNASRVTREVLEDIGFNVNYDVLDNAGWRAARAEPDRWNLFHSHSTGLWHPYLGSTVHIMPEGWVHQYQDTTGQMGVLFDRLFDEVLTSSQVKEITDQINALAYEDVPILSIGEFFQFQAVRKEIKGFVPSTFAVYHNVWREQ